MILPRPTARRVPEKVLYLVYIIAVTLLGTELCLRFGLVISDKYAIHARIKELNGDRKALILGDSFSLNSKGSFARLIEEQLAAEGFATLNLAGPGYGPHDYLLMLKLYGGKFQPDLVILNYFVGNDLNAALYRHARCDSPAQKLKELLNRSYLGPMLIKARAQMYWQKQLSEARDRAAREGDDLQGTASPFLLELGRAHPEHYLTSILVNTPESLAAWRENEKTLFEIVRMTRKAGCRLMLNILPPSPQVTERHHPFFRTMGFTIDRRVLSERVHQDLVLAFCEHHELACLDLLPAFRARSDQSLYMEHDTHWNPEGNRLASEIVKEPLAAIIRS